MLRLFLLSCLIAVGLGVSSCSAVGQGNLCNAACTSSCRGYAPYYAAPGCLDDSSCANPPSGATPCTCGTIAPSRTPSRAPSRVPSGTAAPSRAPTLATGAPSRTPTTAAPSRTPTTGIPSSSTGKPSVRPSTKPSARPTTATPATNEKTVTAKITGYGAPDNCPPGPVDSRYLNGTGSYDFPITTASTYAAVPQGTRIYVVAYKKYFIVDDTCTECDDDWLSKIYHFDLWVGPTSVNMASVAKIGACEGCLSSDSMQVIIYPAATYAVNTAPLFNTATNTCIVACGVCTDDAPSVNTCGNVCAADANNCGGKTCAACAASMLLTTAKFRQLNNATFCTTDNTIIPSGQDVCQAGTCGYPQ